MWFTAIVPGVMPLNILIENLLCDRHCARHSSTILLIITTWKHFLHQYKNEVKGRSAISPRTRQSCLVQGFLILPLSYRLGSPSHLFLAPSPLLPQVNRLATLFPSENEPERLTRNWLLITAHLQVDLCICAVKCQTKICILSWSCWIRE